MNLESLRHKLLLEKSAQVLNAGICYHLRNLNIQLQKMNVIPLVNKPYVNEVTWNEQTYIKNPASPLNWNYVQLCCLGMAPLVNKYYWNEVTLREQNLYQKSCQTSELKLCMLGRLRSFQRGTVGLFRSPGSKVTSCQSWRVDKKFCPQPESNHTSAALVRFLDDRIILQLWQLVTLQSVDLQRPTVPLWKDLNLLNKLKLN